MRAQTWRNVERRARFYDLAEALGELGVWIRLHYVYPYPHVDQVIELMADGRVLPYLDIPFQHASERILKLMKRPAAAENTLGAHRRLAQRRARHHHSQHLHRRLSRRDGGGLRGAARLARGAQLDRVGCFEYSPVEGAAANALRSRRCRTESSRSGAPASWSLPPRSAPSGSQPRSAARCRCWSIASTDDVAIARSASDAPGDRRHRAHPRRRQPEGRRLGARCGSPRRAPTTSRGIAD